MLKAARLLPHCGLLLLLTGAIALGAMLGQFAPASGRWLGERVDATLLIVLGLLFFGVRFDAIVRALGHLRFIALALLANFVLVPLIGWAIARALLPDQPLLMVGLAIYFMAPCTDWFLGFTRLAGGNLALGTALIPVNMGVQLLLYPFYLQLLTRHVAQVQAGVIGHTLLQWFLAPLAMAVLTHYGLRWLLGQARLARLLARVDAVVPWLIALLVAEIFAANIATIVLHRHACGRLLLAVFLFFVATFALSELLSRLARLRRPEHVLLTMTVAARNAPLMLALTMAALPDRPLVHAAIVIGMLLEFPHLTLLRQLLLRRQQGKARRRSPDAAWQLP